MDMGMAAEVDDEDGEVLEEGITEREANDAREDSIPLMLLLPPP